MLPSEQAVWLRTKVLDDVDDEEYQRAVVAALATHPEAEVRILALSTLDDSAIDGAPSPSLIALLHDPRRKFDCSSASTSRRGGSIRASRKSWPACRLRMKSCS
jgi:hypothetical protein